MFTKIKVFVLFVLVTATMLQPVFGQNDDLTVLVNKLLRQKQEQARNARPEIFLLTKSKAVREDIEMVNDQAEQLAEIQKRFDTERRKLAEDFTSKMNNLGKDKIPVDQEMIDEHKSKKLVLENKIRGEMENVLLPHQLKRLNQIATQVHIKKAGHSVAILHPESARFLGISDQQKSRLIKRSNEISKKLEQEIKKLRDKARDEFLAELTPKQRNALDELTGVDLDLGDEFTLRRQFR